MEIEIVLRGVSAEDVPRVVSALTRGPDRSPVTSPPIVSYKAPGKYTGKARLVGGSRTGTVLTADPDQLRVCVDFGDGPEWHQDADLEPVFDDVIGRGANAASAVTT